MQALSMRAAVAKPLVGKAPTQTRAARGPVAVRAAARANWLPGSDFPAHLENCKLPGCYGFDPLGLGANEERLAWFAESERVHCRWAMLGVAGILVQEIVKPDVFWYTSGATVELPFDITGLLAFELFVMHWVESRRGYDIKKPGSMDQDPIFSNFKLPAHEPGYPGGIFAPFVPGSLEELKVKEIKNGRLAMLAFIGFTMAAQVTGKNPLAALREHLDNPLGTTIFSKAVVVPGQAVVPPCAIPDTIEFQGITIPAGCFLHSLWP
ncbi:hypothetical protein COHA_002481 [Chlorella ohadii]|uniref:Chlorophyll a-b binding protein, chloroplastic n=2 Tax=Chlorella ohadii TaxID=2649997 RepID=A0AAD5DX09_9CHLO|nr:hypothetical protein COHA_002481 [Chlorella ohadii]